MISVPASPAFNMAGSYLTTEAACPFCGKGNVLIHIESYCSPVKVSIRCEHLKAINWDDDDGRFVEFGHQTKPSNGCIDAP